VPSTKSKLPATAELPGRCEAGFGDLVADRRLREALTVAFTPRSTALRRCSDPRRQGCRVSLDRGVIAAGDRREPICEIELESSPDRREACSTLPWNRRRAAGAPRQPQQGGTRLHARRESEAGAGQGRTGGVDGADGGGGGLRRAGSRSVSRISRRTKTACCRPRPEYLHQARVGCGVCARCSRVRAASPGTLWALLEQLKTLGQTLGIARDWDVFVNEILTHAVRE